MLSYHASGVAQAMQAEPGWTTDRRSGTRAATTFRKLPRAKPGTSETAATATFISEGTAVSKVDGVVQRQPLLRVGGRLVEDERDAEGHQRRPHARGVPDDGSRGVLPGGAAAAGGEARGRRARALHLARGAER